SSSSISTHYDADPVGAVVSLRANFSRHFVHVQSPATSLISILETGGHKLKIQCQVGPSTPRDDRTSTDESFSSSLLACLHAQQCSVLGTLSASLSLTRDESCLGTSRCFPRTPPFLFGFGATA